MRNKIFISYSRNDRRFRDRLETHFKAMNVHASFWSDSNLDAGDKWEDELHLAMKNTAVAILLVSADFLASDFIRDVELTTLFKAQKESGIIIIPSFYFHATVMI